MGLETGKKPNIIFIIIDALRPRNLSCYGYSKPTSPNIDRLSEKGLLFRDAHSCINATDPSLTSIFSGKFCRSHGVMKHGARVQSDEVQTFIKSTRTLPEILKLNGYRTFAVDWLGRWHKKGYEYYSGILMQAGQWGGQRLTYGQTREYAIDKAKTGLMKYVSFIKSRAITMVKQPKITPRTEIYGDATTVTQKAIEIIKENLGSSFFLFIHYWDTHFPYNSPAHAAEKVGKMDKVAREKLSQVHDETKRKRLKLLGGVDRVIDMYDGSIGLVDREIGKLVEVLTDCGILDDSLIIVTADHGESLSEHGIYFDHHGLYDETIHIPLIFSYAGLPQDKEIKGLVQHPDLIPTILEIIGVKGGGDYDGQSLFPLIYRNEQIHSSIYAEETHSEKKQMVATPKYKYIRALSEKDAMCQYCHIIHGGVEELYDLEKDPGETVNVVAEHPDEVEQLKSILDQRITDCERSRERLKLRGRIRALKRESRI